MHVLTITAALLGDENATVVEVEFPGQIGAFTGSSKREPGERSAPGVGADLALARALQAAAEHLTERAMARLKVVELLWPQQKVPSEPRVRHSQPSPSISID